MKNEDCRMMESLRKIILKKTEYIHSMFDVVRSSVSYLIKRKLTAGGSAYKLDRRGEIWAGLEMPISHTPISSGKTDSRIKSRSVFI